MKQTRITDIWDAIEPTAELAASMRVRSILLIQIQSEIGKRGLRQKDTAILLGISQPRVSDLLRGEIDRFSIDALVDIAHKLGLEIQIITFSNVAIA